MTDFSYTGVGTLEFRGCGYPSKTELFYPRFSDNIFLYIIKAATLRGELEKVYIKKIISMRDVYETVYVDTFNRAWQESELCTYTDASAMASVYLTTKMAAYVEFIKSC